MSVSYTHLDVYKRQPIHLPETTGTSIQELLNEITEETKHLDVNDSQNRKPPKNGKYAVDFES